MKMVILAAFVFGSCLAQETPSPTQPAASASQAAGAEQKWGIKVLWVRPTAGDLMLDFRFKVVDPDKARPVVKRQVQPQLIEAATGVTLSVPSIGRIGQLRSSGEPQRDSNYFIFFDNHQHKVKPGSKVSIVIGDFRVDNITVE